MNLGFIFLFQIAGVLLFCIVAVIYDIRYGIVPDMLTSGLVIFGIVSNFILSLFSTNVKYILASIISIIITYTITYLMWQLNIWGGGDVKLLTGIASVIPFGVDIDFINVFPELSVYPFSFSVIINSILVSFPFLVVFVTYLIFKNKVFRNNIDFLFNIFNLRTLMHVIDSSLNRLMSVKDINEGAIVNECYFNDEHIFNLINETDGNLKVYKSESNHEFKYYFKSQSAGGITEREMYLLKIMGAQGFISDKISVKISFPFTPSILLGLVIAVFYGDIMMIFTKHLVLVV